MICGWRRISCLLHVSFSDAHRAVQGTAVYQFPREKKRLSFCDPFPTRLGRAFTPMGTYGLRPFASNKGKDGSETVTSWNQIMSLAKARKILDDYFGIACTSNESYIARVQLLKTREILMYSKVVPALESIGKTRALEVRPGTELRLVVPEEGEVTMRAHSKIPDTFATAEVFGEELVLGQEYKLEGGTQLAVFSWHGCTVELIGATSQEYDATNSTMRDYVNAVAVVEQKRMRAEEFNTPAPRVLVLGSDGSGKSTLAQFLLNYALRRSRSPIFVELDPRGASSSRQTPSLPGCLTALVADHSAYELGREPIAPHKMFKVPPGTAIDASYLSHPQGKSIWMFYGYYDVNDSPALFRRAAAQLSCFVEAKLEISSEQGRKGPHRSGIIVSAPHSPSADLIEDIIRWYGIDTIFVIDNENLASTLSRKYKVKQETGEAGVEGILSGTMIVENPHETQESVMDVASLARCGGVIPVTQKRMQWLRNQKIKDYFCGVDRDLNPHSFSVHLRDLHIVTIFHAEPNAPNFVDQFRVAPFRESPLALKNSLLSVAVSLTPEDIVMAPMAGLVWVRDVVETEEMGIILHILAPAPAPLISPFLVVGDLRNFKYFEL